VQTFALLITFNAFHRVCVWSRGSAEKSARGLATSISLSWLQKKTKKERKIDPNFEQTQIVFTAPLAKFEVPSLVVFFCLR